MSLAVASPKEPASEEKPQKSLNEKQQVRGLLACPKELPDRLCLLIIMLQLNSEIFFVQFYLFYRRTKTC